VIYDLYDLFLSRVLGVDQGPEEKKALFHL